MNRPYNLLYPNLPDRQHLSPRLAELFDEARKIAARRTESRVERQRLSTEAAEESAREADRQASAAAIRAGKSMSEVGCPAWDELTKARELLDQELDAVDDVLHSIETEMTAEFVAMHGSDKDSGRTALNAAEARYRKALEALPGLRAAFLDAKNVHDFVAGASCLPGFQTFTWPRTDPGVQVNTVSRTGERDYNLRPIGAEHLIRETFGHDLDERNDQ